MIRFVDRKEELALLEEEWRRPGGRFVVVYGRRRIGKTRLIQEFTKDKTGLFTVASDASRKVQIDEFKQAAADFFRDDFLRNVDIKTWKMMFDYLKKIVPAEKKMYIWIDEFSYLIKNDRTIVSALQVFIDHFVREEVNLFLIVSGSLFGMMSEKVLSNTSPLYGRRNRDILLQALPFGDSLSLMKEASFEEMLKIFLTIGGIPEYLLSAGHYDNIADFLQKEFMNRNGYFYREPYYLLSQEFKEIRVYFSILNAVAYGHTQASEIASFSGLQSREIYPYLELLMSYGFLKKELPGVGSQKKGIYLIEDPFFDSWFNFVYKNKNSIEQGKINLDKGTLSRFLGKRFEKFIRDHVFLFFDNYGTAGRWWYRNVEIDIVAVENENREVLFGECKWKDNLNAGTILKELAEKAAFVGWKKEERREKFVLFARSFKEKLNKWNGAEVYCFDLKDIERILTQK
jgi:AAA+ ATPase superfamily predicted ATPase